MKVLAILLVCAFVAVQGRSTAVDQVKSGRSLAALGDSPSVVHLRIAVSTSGFLNSAAGSLISESWVLTSASAVENVRFIWIRYGTVNVINPELVTESSAVRVHHPDPNFATGVNDIALISINRIVHPTANIAPVGKVGGSVPESAYIYTFGDNGADGPGEVLSGWSLNLASENGLITATSGDGKATKYDLGAPLIVDDVQVALLVVPGDDNTAGIFLETAKYIDWIESETGLDLRSTA